MPEDWTEFPNQTVLEGKVRVVVPDLKAYGVVPSDYAPSRAPVFFNPVMEFNRDFSVLALQAYQRKMNKELSICEPLAATGVRGLRYAAEVEGTKSVESGDINEHSVKLAAYNIMLNNMQDRVQIKHKDANLLLIEHSAPKKRFDVVDIDPFGTPVPHLDSAVQALRNNGLLAATATDMAPLCGVHAKACIRKYGGKPLRTEYCQELAVRLLAGTIATVSAKHDIGVQVLFSHCSDHYIRVYSQISYGAQKADEALRKMGYVLHCFSCLHREITSKPFPETALKCPECGGKMEHAGPMWIGEIFNSQFISEMTKEISQRALKTSNKITKLLALTKDEAEMPPTYYVLDRLSGKFGLPAPATAAFFGALHAEGFKAVGTHFNSRGVRTNAPASVMQKILRNIAIPT